MDDFAIFLFGRAVEESVPGPILRFLCVVCPLVLCKIWLGVRPSDRARFETFGTAEHRWEAESMIRTFCSCPNGVSMALTIPEPVFRPGLRPAA
jgi:hypothetical protein